MPKLTIDQREVEVPPGATLLDAARKLGIDIPALCFREGCSPSTSCLVCMVRIDGADRLVPSCATAAAEGMQVESETKSVHQARRTALELLLSDHLGDCVAPCQFGCPAEMDIPAMLRQIAAGQMRDAIVTVKRDIALPAVLGRICPAPCEKVCRRGAGKGDRTNLPVRPEGCFAQIGPVPFSGRGGLDGAVSICLLKRLVADVDLASGDPYVPTCQPSTGKRVAIVGAGPTGLAAAYYLRQFGHACTIFDENNSPGGRLLGSVGNGNTSPKRKRAMEDNVMPSLALRASETPETQVFRQGLDGIGQHELSRDVLEAEIATITRLGIELEIGKRIGGDTGLVDLRARFDAVLLACGTTARDQAANWGLPVTQRGIEAKSRTFETQVPSVFAAGSAVRGKIMVVRSVADGKEVATAIDQFVCGLPVLGRSEPFSTKIGRMDSDELARFSDQGGADIPVCPEKRRQTADKNVCPTGFTAEEGIRQASRCLHCDCRGIHSCKLRKYAAIYQADPRRYKAERRAFQQNAQHAELIYEPGKCIDCGLCIQIAAAAGEPLGLTFVGRGFDVRVSVPLDRPLSEALTKVAAECVAACPTAALAWKKL